MNNHELNVTVVRLLGDDYCIDDGDPIKIGYGGFHPAWSISDAIELIVNHMPHAWWVHHRYGFDVNAVWIMYQPDPHSSIYDVDDIDGVVHQICRDNDHRWANRWKPKTIEEYAQAITEAWIETKKIADES